MIYLRLFWEFFKTGLFAVGGGMATIPFLQNIGDSTGWYTYTDLMNMLAVSESTPGPIGINMATYVGFVVAGVPGAVVATVGEITPSIVVILLVAMALNKFKDNKYVANAFYGLRPASTGLIAAAGIGVALEVLTTVTTISGKNQLFNLFEVESITGLFRWKAVILAIVLILLSNWVKPIKKLHPVVLIAFSAVVGIVFQFANIS